MKVKRPRGPWATIIVALLLATVFLLLGNQSFRATERAAFDEFNQRQLALARESKSGIALSRTWLVARVLSAELGFQDASK